MDSMNVIVASVYFGIAGMVAFLMVAVILVACGVLN